MQDTKIIALTDNHVLTDLAGVIPLRSPHGLTPGCTYVTDLCLNPNTGWTIRNATPTEPLGGFVRVKAWRLLGLGYPPDMLR